MGRKEKTTVSNNIPSSNDAVCGLIFYYYFLFIVVCELYDTVVSLETLIKMLKFH
jgi:hypothetical protein